MVKQDITNIIKEVLSELVNDGDNKNIEITDDTILFGKDGLLDSLKLVRLAVNIEDEIADKLDVDVVIVDDKAMSQIRSPFRTVDVLADYILEKISDGE